VYGSLTHIIVEDKIDIIVRVNIICVYVDDIYIIAVAKVDTYYLNFLL
jgi:hypothetical protein